jgi:hypothetical protein
MISEGYTSAPFETQQRKRGVENPGPSDREAF